MAVAYAAFGIVFALLARPALAESRHPPLIAHVPDGTPTLAELKARLDATDHLAALEAIHVGLSQAADGATYMWARRNGRLSGSVRPTMSFRDVQGRTCRHIVFQILLGEHLRQVEGIACRQGDKSWVLEG